jgi:hypothetical protein
MSKHVRTRDPRQCHSHHQKMLRRFGSLAMLLDFVADDKQRGRKRQNHGKKGAKMENKRAENN